MDYSQITGVVEFASTVTAIALVGGAIAVAMVARRGVEMVLNMIDGHGFVSNDGRYTEDGYDTWGGEAEDIGDQSYWDGYDEAAAEADGAPYEQYYAEGRTDPEPDQLTYRDGYDDKD